MPLIAEFDELSVIALNRMAGDTTLQALRFAAHTLMHGFIPSMLEHTHMVAAHEIRLGHTTPPARFWRMRYERTEGGIPLQGLRV